jgi:predicted Rossmann fold flavoprotein
METRLQHLDVPEAVDVAVIGAGAAGLFAAIWAGREGLGGSLGSENQGTRESRVIALDGATKIGAKILVAGGGRCNVTHHAVDESAYAGSSGHAIKKVLRQFSVEQTVEFFRALGVELKREETGKLFPISDDAHTVLDALLSAVRASGGRIVHPWRVASMAREGDGFVIRRDGEAGTIRAKRVILATGGKSLPKTGSDGKGHEIACSLGHTISDRVFPALVPMTLPKDHWLTALSGLTVQATIELRSGTGKRLKAFTNSTLLAHFGLSGPGVLDISRYWTDERGRDPAAHCVLNWLPGMNLEQVDEALVSLAKAGKQTPTRWLMDRGLPERLARAICEQARVDASARANALSRDARRGLATLITQTPLPFTGDRGWLFAEVTAGGVPLSEVDLATMESRVCPGLFLCGELLNVDGRIGGFNFQWAWASGYVAGRGAARSAGL